MGQANFTYSLLNCGSVKWFGTAEFYLSIGKVFLIFLSFGFTFVTMLGGNPLHDRYGFRYWDSPVGEGSRRFIALMLTLPRELSPNTLSRETRASF